MASSFTKFGHVTTIMAAAASMAGTCDYARANDVAESPDEASSAPAPEAQGSEGIQEVVVTARRREESLQKVPVAVSAFTAADLSSKGIDSTKDLQSLVPGVIFDGAGSDANTTFSIRGQGRDVIGPGLPSVISYFNEVPLGSWGSILPTFDVSSAQVLKGPQGTLFGRNTTGGAVLVYSTAPSYNFGGYMKATGGSYNWGEAEGAVNIPLIDNQLAVRLAVNIKRRQGYSDTHIVDPGAAGYVPPGGGYGADGMYLAGPGGYVIRTDDDHTNGFRASILWEPVNGLKNTLVADYSSINRHGIGYTPYNLTGVPFWTGLDQSGFNGFATYGFACKTAIDCDLALQVARQKAAGPRQMWSDVVPGEHDRFWGLSNTTVANLDSVTVKNIVGFRYTSVQQVNNIDGVSLAVINNPATQKHDAQVSEEFQLSGTAFQDKLSWLLGSFYLSDRPSGTTVVGLDLFRPNDTVIPPGYEAAGVPPYAPQATWPIEQYANTLYSDESRALFANFIYDLSGLATALDGLKLNAGFRYTWDTEGVCAGTTAPTQALFTSLIDCETAAGSYTSSVDSSAPTWTVGVDDRVNDNLFLYVTARRGYRAGNINTPNFGANPVLAPFQTYKPQTVTDVEIGAKTDWNVGTVKGRFNIAVFHDKFKSLQQQITGVNFPQFNTTNADAPGNASFVVNSGEASSNGVEVDGIVIPFRGLKLNFGAAYLNEKYDSISLPQSLLDANNQDIATLGYGATLPSLGQHFDNAPRWSYSAGIQYDIPLDSRLGSVVVGADYYHIDARYRGALLFPAYGLTNARIDWLSVMNSNFDLQFFVNNLTDKVYYSVAPLTGTGEGIFAGGYSPPRMYGGRVTWHFGK
jgi:iron complex outermembrane receptor protein